MRTRILFILLLAVLLISSSTAYAQIIYGQPGQVGLRFYYSSWSLDEQNDVTRDISQKTFNFSGFWPLKENIEARCQILSGFNTLENGSREDELSGLGDLRVQISRSFAEDKHLLSVGVNLPTGSRELDSEGDRNIVELLSHDFLTLPMRRFGEGLGFNLQAGSAAELGRFICGVSAVYDFLGAYTPYEGIGDYNPGDTISFNTSASTMSGRVTYSGNFNLSFHGTDTLEGEDIYKQAPQFSARIMAVRPGDKYSTTLGARLIVRGRNKRYNPADGRIDSQLKKYGDEMGGFARLSFTVRDVWDMSTMMGIKKISANEEELEAATIFNLGLDLSRALGDRLTFGTGLIIYTGSADGGDLDLGGFQMSCGISRSY